MRLSRLWPIVMCAVLLAAAPDAARADLSPPKDVDAKRLLMEGNTHYRLQKFKLAIDKYKAGVQIEDAPVFYYNIGQCLRQWKKYKAAMWFYRRYLGRGDVRPEVSKAVRRFLANMQRELQKGASTDPPTKVAGAGDDDGHEGALDDDDEDGETPKARKKRRRSRKNGAGFSSSNPAWHSDWVGWAITGAGVVAGITGVALFSGAGGLEDKATAEPDQILRDRYRAQADSRRTWGAVFSIASGVAIVGGIVKLALTPRKTLENTNELAVGISTRGIVLSGRF